MDATPLSDSAVPATTAPSDERLRRCLVGGKSLPRERMVRYVVQPGDGGGTLVPDIEGRLPGRGLWTEARRDIVKAAVAKRVFGKAAGAAVAVPADLDERVAGLLARRVVDLVGVARRARQAVAGFDPVMVSLDRGEVGLLLIATDAGASGEGKLSAAAANNGVAVARPLSAEIGRAHV